MKKLRVMTVVGTRPEIIRLSRVIAALDRECDHFLVHTGQNNDFELKDIFFEDLEIRKPDRFLESAGENACATVGNIITRVDSVLEEVRPDALLILGDTNSCLSAYPAKRRKVPVFHMEAGNRCFDERVPEEINRRVVDHIADINLPYSDISREYLLREGLPPDRIIKTGSPMYEVIHYYEPKIERSDVLTRLSLETEKYFLLSCHREENVDSEKNLHKLIILLDMLAEQYRMRLIVTAHPRTRKRIEGLSTRLNPLVELYKPFCFTDYIKLELNAHAVLSDSGTISEESSILNFPALNIRESYERPEGMEEGSVILSGLGWERVCHSLHVIAGQGRAEKRLLNLVRDYDVANVSEKVIRIIISYTDYVNRVVWGKSF
ncbi:MAG: UDP-N-acetylglucosamine 2-epimerase (non-hydrolyzing) [Candidatus Aminicenantales bacterium]|jgi:UDP-N-acetylglucosamine 2-epimerase (non-hydrolysing)